MMNKQHAADAAEELRRIAQNDYMINGSYLPDGQLLNQIADLLEAEHECSKGTTG